MRMPTNLEAVRPIALAEIREARERMAKTIVRTPLVRLELGPDYFDIRLKPENLQPIDAYKLRGAADAVALLSESERKRGVWTIDLSRFLTANVPGLVVNAGSDPSRLAPSWARCPLEHLSLVRLEIRTLVAPARTYASSRRYESTNADRIGQVPRRAKKQDERRPMHKMPRKAARSRPSQLLSTPKILA